MSADVNLMFWQQWQEHQDYLYHCCVKWMGNFTEAEDALSMAMLKARETLLKNTKIIKNFKTWLAKLTYHLCVDILRQRDRFKAEVEDIELVTSSVADSQEESPILAAAQQELENFFGLAIDNLPGRLRDTFILYFEK